MPGLSLVFLFLSFLAGYLLLAESVYSLVYVISGFLTVVPHMQLLLFGSFHYLRIANFSLNHPKQVDGG